MINTNNKYVNIAIDYLATILGTAILCMGIHLFAAPNNIAPGGASGIGTIINFLFDIPIGIVVNLINIPLLLLSIKFLGKKFFIRTIVSTLSFSFFIDVLFKNFPVYTGDPILASVFGGLLMGLATSIIFMREGSTGGTDITNRILQQKFPRFKIGFFVLVTDGIIITIAGFVYKNIENALYSIILIFVATRVIDFILYGSDKGKMALIVCKNPEGLGDKIIAILNRGCTIIDAKGLYSKEKRDIVMCVVRKNQFYKLKRIVHDFDETAFMISSDADEILGQGFKSFKDKK